MKHNQNGHSEQHNKHSQET